MELIAGSAGHPVSGSQGQDSGLNAGIDAKMPVEKGQQRMGGSPFPAG